MGRYFLARSPTSCRMRSSFQQEAELPVTSCHRLGRFAGPGCIYIQSYCCHNTPYPKNQDDLPEISENQCWWSAFLKQSRWFHIWKLNGCNPDWSWGIPSALLRKAEVSEAPLSPVEIQSIILPRVLLKEWKHSWISSKEQGWMEPRWYWTGVCIHIFTQYVCNYMEGFFYIIWLHWETLERAAPLTSPWLLPWPGNAPTSGPHSSQILLVPQFPVFFGPVQLQGMRKISREQEHGETSAQTFN